MYSAFFCRLSSERSYMIERLFLPNGSRGPKQLIDPMGCRSLQTLQDIDQRNRPAAMVAKRFEQQMNVIGHDNECMEVNSRCRGGADALALEVCSIVCEWQDAALAQAMLQNNIASLRPKDFPCGAEGNKQIAIRLLQVRQTPPVPILRERRAGHESCDVIKREPLRPNAGSLRKTSFACL